MNLNRDNYESFFLDYLEGRLSTQERAGLEAFLAANPDLAAELEGFEMITLAEPEVTVAFAEKDQLKKQSASFLTEENREEYYIAYLENHLTSEERLAVEADAASHPAYAKLLETYRHTQLSATGENSDEHFFLYRNHTLTTLTPQTEAAVIVAYLEGWLSTEERKTVEKALAVNPALQKELHAYRRAVVPTEKAVFPDKKRLYRKEGRVVSLYWLRYGAGAVAAGLALLLILNRPGGETLQTAQQVVQPDDTTQHQGPVSPVPLVATHETPQPEPEISQPLKNRNTPQSIGVTPSEPLPETLPSRDQLARQEPLKEEGIPLPTPSSNGGSQVGDTPPLPGQDITQPEFDDLASNTVNNEKFLTPREFVTGKIVQSEGPNEERKSLSPGLGEKISGLFGQKVQVSSETEAAYSTYSVSIGGFEFSRKKQR